MTLRLRGLSIKQVLVTGGAGGLGRATTTCLADAGFRVFSCDIREGEPYKNVVQVILDVRDAASIDAAREKVESFTGKLDAVIHLAGLFMMDSLIEIPEERFGAIMDVNLLGAYRVNKAFLPLVRAGGGRIIITSSEMGGQKPIPFAGVYGISKTALECYADSLRLELQLLGVPVITVRPGAFRTQILDCSENELSRLEEGTKLYAGRLGAITRIMNKRFCKAKDPGILARVYLRAVTARKPKARYTVNASLSLKLYSAMPRALQSAAMRILLREKGN